MSQEASVALTEADPEQTTTIHSLYLFTSSQIEAPDPYIVTGPGSTA